MRSVSNRAAVEFDLERGGRISRLVVDGLSLLVDPVSDPLGWGAYVMAPWAGRVRDGRFEFAGERHTLPRRGEHAQHGTVLDRAWDRIADDRLVTDLGPAWPWPGRVEQRFELTDDWLRLELEVHAEHDEMPVIVGWHPWFRRELARGGPLQLEVQPEAAWEVDEDLIPTGRVVPVPEQPWDMPFTRLAAPPVLRWPGALELEMTSSHDCWVVYSEPEHAACVEPQTDRPDALSTTTVVRPGEPLRAWTRWRWT